MCAHLRKTPEELGAEEEGRILASHLRKRLLFVAMVPVDRSDVAESALEALRWTITAQVDYYR